MKKAKYPNWPVTPWPTEYSAVLKWQWGRKINSLLGKKRLNMQKDHNVKIGIELHAGFFSSYTLYAIKA
jgi:hypothetical protein